MHHIIPKLMKVVLSGEGRKVKYHNEHLILTSDVALQLLVVKFCQIHDTNADNPSRIHTGQFQLYCVRARTRTHTKIIKNNNTPHFPSTKTNFLPMMIYNGKRQLVSDWIPHGGQILLTYILSIKSSDSGKCRDYRHI